MVDELNLIHKRASHILAMIKEVIYEIFSKMERWMRFPLKG